MNRAAARRIRVPPGPSLRSTLVLVLVSFVLAGLAQPLWDHLAGDYAGAVASVARPLVIWLQPVPMTARLIVQGTDIVAGGDLLPGTRLGPIHILDYSFYLPFIGLMLGIAAWRWRLVSMRELLLILLFLFTVHAVGLAFDVLLLQSIFFAGRGASPFGPLEETLLHGLYRIYVLFGMQLWNGLAVALVLARAVSRARPDGGVVPAALSSPRGLGVACGVLLLPALLYVFAAPPLRFITGGAARAAAAVALIQEPGGGDTVAGRAGRAPAGADGKSIEMMMRLAGEVVDTDLDEAAGWYNRVLELNPQHANANYFLGRIRVRQRNWTDAAVFLEKVVDLRPEHAESRLLLGDAYVGQADHEAAREQYERAIAIDPAQPGALARLGRIAQVEGDACAARRLYQRAIAAGVADPMSQSVTRYLDQAERDCTVPEREGE